MIRDLTRLHAVKDGIIAATDGLDFPSRLAAVAYASAALIARDVPQPHWPEAKAMLRRQMDDVLALLGAEAGETGRPS